MTIPLKARHSKPVTLPAATPTPVDLPVNGARDWLALIANTGANPITAITLAPSPLGSLFADPVGAPAGVPLAAGATLPIKGENEPITTLRVVLTSELGTTATLEVGGL